MKTNKKAPSLKLLFWTGLCLASELFAQAAGNLCAAGWCGSFITLHRTAKAAATWEARKLGLI